MNELYWSLLSSLWLGILTSISPCPLATNVTAISYISRNLKNVNQVLASGFLYALGRMATYIFIGFSIVYGVMASTSMSFFLQKYIAIIIGPILIITALFLFGFIDFNFGQRLNFQKLQNKFKDKGLVGSFVLGILFALTFCPVSAALFFGSLIPLAIKIDSSFLASAFFGFGTALPVFVVAFFIAFSSKKIGELFNNLTKIEKWMRTGTAVIIFAIGIYLTILNFY